MIFTQGSVVVDNSGLSDSKSFKNIIEAIEQCIPYITIKTESGNTIILVYNGLEIQVRLDGEAIYIKVGNSSEFIGTPSIDGTFGSYSVFSYKYSQEGLFFVNCAGVYARLSQFKFSLIPFRFKFNDGTEKEIYAIRFNNTTGCISGLASFDPHYDSQMFFDAETGERLDSSSTYASYPGYGMSGKAVLAPISMFLSCGEVVDYNVIGSGKLFCIYQGNPSILSDEYPGVRTVTVNSEQYMAISESIFIQI